MATVDEKLCLKGGKRDIMDHIEAYHITGISIPCDICERVFKSRNSLAGHTFKKHEKKKLTDYIIENNNLHQEFLSCED